MYLSEVRIRNFRNFEDCGVALSKGLTVIVGENNVGKSNFLCALQLIFSPDASDRTRRLARDDFCSSRSESDEPPEIIISCTLKGFDTDEEKSVVATWLTKAEDEAKVTYAYRCTPRGKDLYRKGNPIPVEHYDWVIYGGDEETRDRFDYDQLKRISLDILGALRDAEGSLRPGARSTLAAIVRRFSAEEDDKKRTKEALERLNKVLGEAKQVRDAQKAINDNLKAVSGSTFAQEGRLTPVGSEYEDLLRNLMLEVRSPGGTFQTLNCNGLGFNNLVFVSALLADYGRRHEGHELVLPILAIEEPEAHLHPHLQRVLIRNFHKSTSASQVIATTHSTHVTSSLSLDSLVVLNRDAKGMLQVIRVSGLFDGVDSKEKKDLERYLDATKSTLFFAKSVLLVEGMAETLILPCLARMCARDPFEPDEKGISVIPVNSLAFRPFLRLFGSKAIGRRCVALMDSDSSGFPLETKGVTENATVKKLREEFESEPSEYVRIVTNLKTLEYDLAVATQGDNADPRAPLANEKQVIAALKNTPGIVRSNIPEVGVIKDRPDFGKFVVELVDRKKGRFAQALADQISESFVIPGYIQMAFDFVTGHASS